MWYELLLTINVIGLGMLLGGAVYESVVINPNYRTNIPSSLEHVRKFMKVKTPADYFRMLSPLTMISLLITLIINWSTIPARWWSLASFISLIIADIITFSFHYPRNKVMFIEPLTTDNSLLTRYANQWQTGNKVRIFLILASIVCVMLGIFSVL
jgi:uncharacterized membrane protein